MTEKKDGIINTQSHDKEKKKSDRRQERDDNDLRKLLVQPEFRRFVWRLFTFTGMYRTSFTGNSTTFFNEGVRSVGLWFLGAVMRANKMAFAQIQQEFYSEATSEEIIRQREDIERSII